MSDVSGAFSSNARVSDGGPADGGTPMEAAASDDPKHQWRIAVSELENIDGVIKDLKAELKQLELRREELKRRLAPQAGGGGEGRESVPLEAAPGPKLSVLEAHHDEEESGPLEAAPGPKHFVLEADHDEEDCSKVSDPSGSSKLEATPDAKHFVLEAGHDDECVEVPDPNAASKPVSPKSGNAQDDWERGFDALGVAKCGVCGMKLPLDVASIEQHSLECEAATQEGRKPAARPRVMTDPSQQPNTHKLCDRAASLRNALAARAATPVQTRSSKGGASKPSSFGKPARIAKVA